MTLFRDSLIMFRNTETVNFNITHIYGITSVDASLSHGLREDVLVELPSSFLKRL